MNTNKISLSGNKSKNDNKTNVLNIYYGYVVSNDDPEDMMRLKVRIDGLDNSIDDKDLPYSLPLLPKFFHIIPQVSEAVMVLISNTDKPYNLRKWIGSVISQPQFFEFDPYYYSALNGTEYQRITSQKSLKIIPDGRELHPEKEDVAVIGRYNTDIIQRKKEIILRTGIHDDLDKTKLNKKNPAYVKLNFNSENLSTTMLVADRIGIISHKNRNKYKPILDNNEIDRFFKEASSMAKGDVLLEALKIFREAIINHVHGGTNLEANNSNIIKSLKELNLENILSENIKIN